MGLRPGADSKAALHSRALDTGTGKLYHNGTGTSKLYYNRTVSGTVQCSALQLMAGTSQY